MSERQPQQQGRENSNQSGSGCVMWVVAISALIGSQIYEGSQRQKKHFQSVGIEGTQTAVAQIYADQTPEAPVIECREVSVQSGDGWSQIAKRELGDGSRWKELAQHNSTDGSIPRLYPKQIIEVCEEGEGISAQTQSVDAPKPPVEVRLNQEQLPSDVVAPHELYARNIHLHYPDNPSFRLHIREGAFDNFRLLQDLEKGKVSNLEIVMVDEYRPENLPKGITEKYPGVLKAIKRNKDQYAGEFFMLKQGESNDVVIVIKVGDYLKPKMTDSHPDENLLKPSVSDEKYPLEGRTAGITLNHEFLHYDEKITGSGGMEKEEYVSYLTTEVLRQARRRYVQSKDDAGYFFIFETRDGNVYTDASPLLRTIARA